MSRLVRKFASPEFMPYICRTLTLSEAEVFAVIDSDCGIAGRSKPNVAVGENV